MFARSCTGLVLAGFALLASGCDRKPASKLAAPVQMAASAPAPAEGRAWFTPSPQRLPGVQLAYSHEIGLQIDGGALRAHFIAARDRCLNTPTLHCLLLQASFSASAGSGAEATEWGGVEPGGPASQQAGLRVRLPHDQVASFANALTDRLPGETAALAHVVRQSTSAEDLSRPTTDVAQRVAQLTDYLASLKSLGSRLTISVSDLVKIASETAQAQSQMEAVQAEQRTLSQRVDTEELSVDFEDSPPVHIAEDPVSQVWSQADPIFRRSVAHALEVGIAAVPWLPAALVAVVLLALVRMAVFGRRRRHSPIA